MKLLFVIPCGGFVACGAVRVLQYLSYLDKKKIEYKVINYHHPFSIIILNLEESLNWNNKILQNSALFVLRVIRGYFNRFYGYYVFHRISADASCYDAVFSQRIIFPEKLLSRLKGVGCKVIFDFDDAVFLESPDSVVSMVEKSWGVVAGSSFLYDYAIAHNRHCVLVPSSVPIENFPKTTTASAKEGAVVIGWIGSSHTLHYLSVVYDALQELVKDGYRIKLLLAGTWGARQYAASTEGLEIIDIDFYKAEDIPAIVGTIDVGIMPLFDTPWEKGKCAMKALLYMAGAKPVVSSPVGEALQIIEDGVNGFLAGSTYEWKEKLRKLIVDPGLRLEMGQKGRITVEDCYSTEVCFSKLYASMLKNI